MLRRAGARSVPARGERQHHTRRFGSRTPNESVPRTNPTVPTMARPCRWRRWIKNGIYARSRRRSVRLSVRDRTVALVQIKDDNHGYHAVDSSVETAYHPHCVALVGSRGRGGVDRRLFYAGVRLAEIAERLVWKASYLPAEQGFNRGRDLTG